VLRERLDGGAGATTLAREWAGEVEAFLPVRQRYLLYR
jgi:hypothetical protein